MNARSLVLIVLALAPLAAGQAPAPAAPEKKPLRELPYTPSLDRVEAPAVPDWCAHWPRAVETSGDFDWEKEFNF